MHTPRYELVDGELLVTPGPSGVHQKAVLRLIVALYPYLERTDVGELLSSPSDVQLEAETLVQPDLYVVTPAEGRRLITEGRAHELLLAIEVVSPSSARHDRGAKRVFYQRTVPEYWIVDTAERLVERWRRGAQYPEVISGRLEWDAPRSHEPFVMELEPFFVKVFGESGVTGSSGSAASR